MPVQPLWLGPSMALPQHVLDQGLPLNVKLFGAVGDGAADDTAAIQDAVNAFENGYVDFPAGTYRTTSIIDLPSGATLRGLGARIEVDGTHSAFRGRGDLGTLVPLASDAARGAVTVVLNDGSGFAAGDMIWLQSEAQATTLATNKKGELATVKSVAGNTLTLSGALHDSYATADTAKAAVVTPVQNITIQGLDIRSLVYPQTTTPTNPLLTFDFAHGVTINGVTLREANGLGIQLRNTMGATVAACVIQDLRDDTGNLIFGYGINLGHATCDVAVTGNVLRRMRHGVTMGTASSGPTPNYGIPRDIAIVGNSVSDTTHAGLDTHEDGEGVTISGNVVAGCAEAGIQVRCWGVAVTGNTIRNTRGIGIFIRPSAGGVSVTDASPGTTVQGNVIEYTRLSPSAANGEGIRVDGRNCLVSGNRVFRSARHGISISASRDITIAGNSCIENGMEVAGDGIFLNANAQRVTIQNNSCWDLQASKTQLYGVRITNVHTGTPNSIQVGPNNLTDNATGPYLHEGTGRVILDLASTGAPESVHAAGAGSIYRRIGGGASTTLYVKESGDGNTGWVAK